MKKFLLLLLTLVLLNVNALPIHAANNTKGTALPTNFEQEYTRKLTPTTEQLGYSFFAKFTTPRDGMVRIVMTQPVDTLNNNKTYPLQLTIYNNINNYQMAVIKLDDKNICPDPKSCYVDIGLKQGTYYLEFTNPGSVAPATYNITYNYLVVFRDFTGLYEYEPNDGGPKEYTKYANPIHLNTRYFGNTLYTVDNFKLSSNKNRNVQIRFLTPSLFMGTKPAIIASMLEAGETDWEPLSPQNYKYSSDRSYVYTIRKFKTGDNYFELWGSNNKINEYSFVVFPYFYDVADNNEFHQYIVWLAEKDIINGYEDGNFGLHNRITRAEAATIIVKSLKLPTAGLTAKFKDVPQTYWASSSIAAAANAGIISGYQDGTFKPNAPITRAELAKMVSIAYKLSVNSTNVKSFSDVPKTHWAYSYINILSSQSIVNGFPDGRFKPSEFATRAQFAKIIYNSMLK